MRTRIIFLQIVCLLFFASVNQAQEPEKPPEGEATQTAPASEQQPSGSSANQTPAATQTQQEPPAGESPEPLYLGFPMQTRWKFRAQGPVIARPEVDGSSVYLASKGGFVYRVMQTQSKQVWRKNLNDAIEESFLLSGDTIFVGTAGGNVHALHKDNGKELWKQTLEDQVFRKKPAADADRIYFVGITGTVTALEKGTGKLLWKFKARGECMGEPFVTEEVVLAGCNDQMLYALDLRAGFVRWKFKADGEIQGSPIADDRYVYFGSESGHFFCVERVSGAIRWKRRTGGAIRGTPMFYRNERKGTVEDILITSYDNFLYRLSIKNGGRRWLSPTTTRAETGMHLDRALIFLAPFGQLLYGYDPHTGDRVGEFNAGARIRSAPVTAADRLFIGLNNGNLICAMRVPPPKPETDEVIAPLPAQTPGPAPVETPPEQDPPEQEEEDAGSNDRGTPG